MAKKHPKGIRPREGFWHFRIEWKGNKISGNTGLAATQQNAKQALKIREAALLEMMAGVAGPPNSIRFPEAASEFGLWCETEYRKKPNTWKRIKGSLSSMVEFWSSRNLAEFSPSDVEDYKVHRVTIHRVKDVTLRHDLHNLSLMNAYAKKKKWTGNDWLRGVSIPSDEDAVRIHVLTDDEEFRYFGVLRPGGNLADLARLMLEQGCRPEELLALTQDAVDLKTRQIEISGGKSRAAKRILNLTAVSIEILDRRLNNEGKWIFPSSRKPGGHVQQLKTTHDKACIDAGVSFVLYDCRHTFATRYAAAHPDPYALAAVLGHSSLRCVMKYVHVQSDHMKYGMERFEAAQMRRRIRIVG